MSNKKKFFDYLNNSIDLKNEYSFKNHFKGILVIKNSNNKEYLFEYKSREINKYYKHFKKPDSINEYDKIQFFEVLLNFIITKIETE